MCGRARPPSHAPHLPPETHRSPPRPDIGAWGGSCWWDPLPSWPSTAPSPGGCWKQDSPMYPSHRVGFPEPRLGDTWSVKSRWRPAGAKLSLFCRVASAALAASPLNSHIYCVAGKDPQGWLNPEPLKMVEAVGEGFWKASRPPLQAAGWSPFVSWPWPCSVQGRVQRGLVPGERGPQQTLYPRPLVPARPAAPMMQGQSDPADRSGH